MNEMKDSDDWFDDAEAGKVIQLIDAVNHNARLSVA